MAEQKKGKGFLMVTMEPTPAYDEEFNDWYDMEHIPDRTSIPGFETGRRFVCLSGWPRYLSMYDLTTIDVLARRMRLAFIDCDAAEQAVERVVELMAPELKWDRARKKDEIAKTKEWLKTMHLDDRDF